MNYSLLLYLIRVLQKLGGIQSFPFLIILLDSLDISRTEKKKQISELIMENNMKSTKENTKQIKALAGLLAGCSTKLSDLFADKSLDEEEHSTISFSDNNYEESISSIELILTDRFLLSYHYVIFFCAFCQYLYSIRKVSNF